MYFWLYKAGIQECYIIDRVNKGQETILQRSIDTKMYVKISLVHILAILGPGVCYQQDETLKDAYPYYYPSGKGLTNSLFGYIFDT